MKAVALISSGLDSLLAVKAIRDLGIEVIGLHCMFHFDSTADSDIQNTMNRLFNPVNIPVVIRNVTNDFYPILINPEHGYGKEVNPCIDCKIFMLRQAKQFMNDIGASFIITGDVVGQRPMTQKQPILYFIEKKAAVAGMVVRPLSAKKLRKSQPEQKGWIDRSRLYGISGRGRKLQIALAEKFGINEYEQPAGGCILTTPQFGQRARALFRNRKKSEISVEDIQLLRLGRHYWPSGYLHVIVGRNEQDNRMLEAFAAHRTVIEPLEITGPLTLVENARNQEDLNIAAAITARYCKHRNHMIKMRCRHNNEEGVLTVIPFSEQKISAWRI
ncbi:tRNA 4-thiouridine(8) synthase ThiI [bacterium]|nr:tRNA 4-thiouridine(8) synthase ThiI [bacterium]